MSDKTGRTLTLMLEEKYTRKGKKLIELLMGEQNNWKRRGKIEDITQGVNCAEKKDKTLSVLCQKY